MENQSSLLSLVGKTVRIGRGGPEARKGRLLAVKPDHLVLHCEDEGVIYYKTDHIKSLTVDSQSNQDAEQEEVDVPSYIDAENFADLLKNMQLRWVQINRGGPEKVEGVLVESNENDLVLTTNKEIVRIFNFHVRNISYGVTQKKQNENEDKENKENKEKEKDKDKENDKNENKKTNHKNDQEKKLQNEQENRGDGAEKIINLNIQRATGTTQK